jgi:outer membrane protein assembly factor BamB
MTSNILFVGVKAHVVAIDKTTGAKLWQTKLKGGMASGDRFVSLLVQEGRVYAHTYGELYCLDQETGAVLWKNPLDGLSHDIATLACEGATNSLPQLTAALHKKQVAEAAASGASAGAGGNHH